MRIPIFLLALVAVALGSAAAMVLGSVHGDREILTSDKTPELTRWINDRLEKHYKSTGLRSPDVVDDATFLRRVSLDLSGRIPTVGELRDFRQNSAANKRIEVVDRLLESERFAEHTARIWRRILVPPNSNTENMPITGLDQWLKQQIQSNTPMDSVARSLVTAGGAENKTDGKSAETDPKNSASLVSPLPYLVSTGGQAPEMASSVSRVFLGVKLECAMCHDHPFADWTQEDFWGLAAFFSGAPRYDRFANLNPDSPQWQPSLDVRELDIVDTCGTRYTVSLPWLDEDRLLYTSPSLPES